MWSPNLIANPSLPTSLIPTKLQPFPSSASPSAVISNEDDHSFLPPPSSRAPHLSFSNPTWIVQTESNVRKWVRKKSNPPCVVCNGRGKVDCKQFLGKGRTNYTHLTMLPSGEWPKWCRTCGGSGLCYCDRCLGTGEYRDILGFHFLKDANLTKDSSHITVKIQEDEHLGAADFLLSERVYKQDESS